MITLTECLHRWLLTLLINDIKGLWVYTIYNIIYLYIYIHIYRHGNFYTWISIEVLTSANTLTNRVNINNINMLGVNNRLLTFANTANRGMVI